MVGWGLALVVFAFYQLLFLVCLFVLGFIKWFTPRLYRLTQRLVFWEVSLFAALVQLVFS